MSEQLFSLPKEFWLPNDSSKTCRKCEKGFSALMRRHHCRYCGLIFCDKCVKLNPKLGSDSKLLRICANCIVLFKDSIMLTGLTPSELTNSFSSSLISAYDDTDEIDENILDLLQELHQNNEVMIEVSTSEFIKSRCEQLLLDNGLSGNHSKLMIAAVNEVIETVCPSVKFRKDLMNINKYVKIITVQSQNFKCEFLQGTAVMKNIANKKMPRHLDWPKILFLENEEQDADLSGLVTINNLITEESVMTKLFIKKVMSISPNILVSQKTLSEKAIKKLTKRGIVAIINVNPKDFYHLARITRGHVLKSINQACFIDKTLGYCRKMDCQPIGHQTSVYFRDIKDYTLGGCMLIYGESAKILKKIMRQLLIDYRNAKLERILLLECGAVWHSALLLNMFCNQTSVRFMCVCKNNICTRATVMEVVFYQDKDLCLGEFLIALCEESEKICGKCGNFNQDHIYYYIKGERVVKVSMFKIKIIKENDIFLSTNCRECHKSVSTHYLANAAWEYSFFKFISNFFCINQGTAKCGHQIFRNSFKFQIGNKQILFGCEDYKKYALRLSNQLVPNPVFNKTLISESLKDTQISSKCVLDNILNHGKGIVIKINQEMAVVDSAYEQWLELRQKLLETIESIYKIMREVFEPDASAFVNFFEVEAMRRGLFFECCKFKAIFSVIEEAMRKIKPAVKKTSMMLTGSLTVSDPTYIDPEFLMDEDLVLYFYKLQSGNLTLPLCNSCFVPVYENDCGSLISYLLCTSQYHQEILKKSNQNIETVLLSAEASDFSIQVNSYDGMDIKLTEPVRKVYGDHIQFSVTCSFPLHFQALRTALNISHENFAISLARSVYKSDELGKSGAIFKKSHDHLYIIKVIDEREYRMFVNLAPNYFVHMCKGIFHNMPTLLNVCLGAYKINFKNFSAGKSRTEWCLVFENIGHDLKGPTIAYDLKGTTNKRRKVKNGDKKTKMDLNFVEDFASLPLPLTGEQKHFLEVAVMNDTLLLGKQNIIDYSMLIVISLKEMKIGLGIIDYMQQYTLDKVIESKYKAAVGTQAPTITHPDQYKTRFRDQILNCYFLAVDE